MNPILKQQLDYIINYPKSSSDYKYEYDEIENRIKRETIEDSKIESVSERVIEYR